MGTIWCRGNSSTDWDNPRFWKYSNYFRYKSDAAHRVFQSLSNRSPEKYGLQQLKGQIQVPDLPLEGCDYKLISKMILEKISAESWPHFAPNSSLIKMISQFWGDLENLWFVGEIAAFLVWRYFGLPDDICNYLRLSLHWNRNAQEN